MSDSFNQEMSDKVAHLYELLGHTLRYKIPEDFQEKKGFLLVVFSLFSLGKDGFDSKTFINGFSEGGKDSFIKSIWGEDASQYQDNIVKALKTRNLRDDLSDDFKTALDALSALKESCEPMDFEKLTNAVDRLEGVFDVRKNDGVKTTGSSLSSNTPRV